MNTPLTTVGTVDESKNLGAFTDQCLMLGLTLTLPGRHDVKSATQHIQEQYFDILGLSGFFRLMGQHHRQLANREYLSSKSIPEHIFNDAVRITTDGNTEVDVLFCQMSFEGAPEEELRCTQLELNEAVNSRVILNYEQFSLI